MEGTALSTFLTSITGALSDFSVANLGVIMVAALGIAAAPALARFGYRWVVGKLSAAIKRGRIG